MILPFRLDSPDLLQPTRHMSAVLVDLTAQLYKDTRISHKTFKDKKENVAAAEEGTSNFSVLIIKRGISFDSLMPVITYNYKISI